MLIELTFCGEDSEQGILKCQTVLCAIKKKIRESERTKKKKKKAWRERRSSFRRAWSGKGSLRGDLWALPA